MLTMPKTSIGKWSVGLGAAFVALFTLSQILFAPTLQAGKEIAIDSPLLPLLGLTGIIAGLLSFFTGIFSIIKNKERSMFVFLTVSLSSFVVIFVLGEIIVSH